MFPYCHEIMINAVASKSPVLPEGCGPLPPPRLWALRVDAGGGAVNVGEQLPRSVSLCRRTTAVTEREFFLVSAVNSVTLSDGEE